LWEVRFAFGHIGCVVPYSHQRNTGPTGVNRIACALSPPPTGPATAGGRESAGLRGGGWRWRCAVKAPPSPARIAARSQARRPQPATRLRRNRPRQGSGPCRTPARERLPSRHGNSGPRAAGRSPRRTVRQSRAPRPPRRARRRGGRRRRRAAPAQAGPRGASAKWPEVSASLDSRPEVPGERPAVGGTLRSCPGAGRGRPRPCRGAGAPASTRAVPPPASSPCASGARRCGPAAPDRVSASSRPPAPARR